ncbi:FAD-dependent oxidoreductase, partial [Streptomyces tendae]
GQNAFCPLRPVFRRRTPPARHRNREETNSHAVGHRWERTPGVTLLGDAAHLMSPFAGEGANLAMYDGAELALALAAHPGDTEAALTAYEAALFPRSEASAVESAASLDTMFGEDGLEQMVGFFTSDPTTTA